ncbi:MAG: prolyl oligopeptidase family serine peptidase [Janthinobacterium lividum]
MRLRYALLLALSCAIPFGAATASPAGSPAPEPPAFLTDIEGRPALDWVAGHNSRTFGVLEHDPRYAGFHADALSIAQAHDRIPTPHVIDGQVYNFWQDAEHRRGLWRRTSLTSYRSAAPDWHTVIDLDALSAAEHANWVWKSVNCAEPEERRCLVTLSDAGEDATTVREFDVVDGRFVPGGFVLPYSKQTIVWEDPDTLLVARDWGAGSLTASGYPFIVKRLRRGQAVDAAVELARGVPSDISDVPDVLVDGDGHRAKLIVRGVTFFTKAYQQITPQGLLPLSLPPKATVIGLVSNRLVIKLDQEWQPGAGPVVRAGSLVSLDLSKPQAAPQLVFAPGPRQSVESESVGITRHHVVAAIYDNVRGGATIFTPTATGWSARHLALPDNVAVSLVDNGRRDDHVFLQVTGFLTPTELWLADAATGHATQVKALPAQFDAAGLVVDQREATSKDGTKIPYFMVHRRGLKLDGANPTELTAYGGFGISSTPLYSGAIGRLWLKQGGVYVLANIRGGGEFGPAWHEAGRKTDRQRVFDDFTAVGQDLITRGVTSARRLGIRGRSNGGLLMGVEFTQHPELWQAVIIGVPLLDMLHFETMPAGASWVDEYGSVSKPDERAFLAKISPLQNLRAGVHYPEPFIFTSTKDDRVGPVHARRFAWTLDQLGLPFLYYEDTEGGHAGTANLSEIAHEQALEAVYLTRKLVDR